MLISFSNSNKIINGLLLLSNVGTHSSEAIHHSTALFRQDYLGWYDQYFWLLANLGLSSVHCTTVFNSVQTIEFSIYHYPTIYCHFKWLLFSQSFIVFFRSELFA